LDKDWGDQSEAALNSVLSYIGTGSFTNGGLNSRLQLQKISENKALNRNFKGAIAK
jgi:hypothetical protein